MKTRIALTCVSLVLLIVIFGRSSFRVDAQSVTNITSCQTINASGSYRLMNDVSTGSGFCFSIRAGNVTFDGNGKTITSGTDDALEVADFSNNEDGFSTVTVKDFSSTGGVRIYGNNISNVSMTGLHVESITNYAGDDVTIQNNTIGQGGLSAGNADRDGWYPLRNHLLNNTITGGSTDVKILLEVVGGKVHPCPRLDTEIRNNTVLSTRNDPPPEATAAIRIRCATHSIVTDNTFHSTGTTIGLYIRDESDDGQYYRNTFWTNSEEAIRMASGNVDKTYPSRNIFRDNIFRSDNGPSTFLQGVGSDNFFQNNVFWSADQGQLYSGAHGNTFDHNTWYVTSGGTAATLFGYRTGPPDSWTNNIFSIASGNIFSYEAWNFAYYTGNNNLFQNRSGSVTFGTPAGSLAAWRTNSGNTDDMNSIEANPLFIDAANGDFHLASSSPARGAGTNGSDIGAFPYTTPGCAEQWSCAVWPTCANSTQTRTCAETNSCGTVLYRPSLTQACDSTPPTVGVTSPSDNANISTTTTLAATATDNLNVSVVKFYIDGQWVGEDTSAPYQVVNWDSTTVTNATHALTAVAVDGTNNSTTSSAINLVVNNGAGCVENWTNGCTAWSTCSNGTQTRTCVDANNCGTTVNRPPLSQSCAVSDTTPPATVQDLTIR